MTRSLGLHSITSLTLGPRTCIGSSRAETTHGSSLMTSFPSGGSIDLLRPCPTISRCQSMIPLSGSPLQMGLAHKAEMCAKASKTYRAVRISIQSIKHSSPEASVVTIRHSPHSARSSTTLSASPTCSKKRTSSTMRTRSSSKPCQASE